MRKLVVLFVALAIAACGGSSTGTPDGPLKLGITSGNNQIANAGSAQLTDPVVGTLVRVSTAQGPRFEFVKTAYAQTVVTGSPVAGAVVCAVSVTPNTMVPFVPCTNTDALGKATFFFAPGTLAGVQKAEIRGTLAGQPAVFDTAKATVLPGAATSMNITVFRMTVAAGSTVDLHTIILNTADQYNNLIYDHFFPGQSTYVPRWTVAAGIEVFPGPPPDSTGWTATIPMSFAGKTATLYMYADAYDRGVILDVK